MKTAYVDDISKRKRFFCLNGGCKENDLCKKEINNLKETIEASKRESQLLYIKNKSMKDVIESVKHTNQSLQAHLGDNETSLI